VVTQRALSTNLGWLRGSNAPRVLAQVSAAEQLVGRERGQRASHRQVGRNAVVSRRVNSNVMRSNVESEGTKKLNHYRSFKCCLSLIFVFVVPVLGGGQNEETVRRTKLKYEKEHPGKRTYFIEEFVAALDSADTILPNAKSLTYEKSKTIGGVMFGTSLYWKTSTSPKRLDAFTETYFGNNNLKQFILQNLFTDPSAFEKFMDQHHDHGFYRVIIWKPGFLMFFMAEGRQTDTGLKYIVVPAKSGLFDGAKVYGARNP
jgi:hypothetical protein